ncbi:MAG: alpha-glucosidase C-terminal domain-containing protein, partial [Rudaea sp.]
FLTIAGEDKSALRLAMLTMMTYPGAPMIYYGDEIGMVGGKDPDSRRSMIWDETRWDHDLRNTIKQYIALRKKYIALRRRSEYAHLYSQGKVYAFARKRDGQTVIVALNAGTEPATIEVPIAMMLADGAVVNQEWSGEKATVNGGRLAGLTVTPRDGAVWAAT